MRKKYLPNLPFVKATSVGVSKQKATAVRVRLVGGTSASGSALAIAMNWSRLFPPNNSSHYIVDSTNAYQCVPHWSEALPKKGDAHQAVSIAMCAERMNSREGLGDLERTDTFIATADLVARSVLAHRIRLEHLQGESVSKWEQTKKRRHGGIIVDADGWWPELLFMNLVKAKIELLKG